jgi:transposase
MARISRLPATGQPDAAEAEANAGEVVLGVDTHRDVHVAAVVTVLGALVATKAFSTTEAGYRQLVAWASSFGILRRAGVECTGSYGAALTRQLLAEGLAVVEVNQPDKATRRKRGKTDAIDAEAAARAVLSGRATATAKTGDGVVEAMRVLKLARDSAVNARTKAINQLKAILINAEPKLSPKPRSVSSWLAREGWVWLSLDRP